MFVKPAVLKKLMKQQYKTSGLVVANNGPTIYIGGDWWGIETVREFIPNQIKAAIIELTGEFPEEGEIFNATKDGNQMQMDINNMVTVESNLKKLKVTRLLINYEKQMRMLQDEKSNEIALLDETFVAMIDNKEINAEEGESLAKGPFIKNKAVYWKNNVSSMKAYVIQPNEALQDMIKSLESMKLK